MNVKHVEDNAQNVATTQTRFLLIPVLASSDIILLHMGNILLFKISSVEWHNSWAVREKIQTDCAYEWSKSDRRIASVR